MRLQYAEIQWDESGPLYSPKFADIYHSRQGGLAESRHVFLNGNSLAQRFAELTPASDSFTVAEIGFGSGLNFLLTWKLWQQSTENQQSLHYLAFEQFPMDAASLRRVYKQWPQLQSLTAELLTGLPGNCAGLHRLHLSNRVTLDLYLGDARSMLQQKHQFQAPEEHKSSDSYKHQQVNAWFLDGFSPAKNPELWSVELFQLIADNSGPGTTLSSYSVASAVLTALQRCGFHTAKATGFGKKRHMLVAHYAPTISSAHKQLQRSNASWFMLPPRTNNTKTAVIIGAGLAGSSSAFSLARRGWKVLVIDKAGQVANGASGNPQAVLHCRLSQQRSATAEFMLQGYLYALRLYQNSELGKKSGWRGCGVLQLANALNRRKPLAFNTIERLYSDAIVSRLSLADSCALGHAELKEPAWLFPLGGWLNPILLCQAFLAHENIEVKLNTQAKSLLANARGWTVTGDEGSTGIGEAAIVIIANSDGASQFSQSQDIPLLSSRGQISLLQATPASERLAAVISGPRSICPAENAMHTIGASYSALPDGNNPGPSIECADADNYRAVCDLFANPDFLSTEIVDARGSVRCNSPDQVPVVGMLPIHGENLDRYRDLARNARRPIKRQASYYPGLFLNVAHGSNGLCSCPLSAEFLASVINNEHNPLTRAQTDCLNPIRFLIRDLKKQRAVPPKD